MKRGDSPDRSADRARVRVSVSVAAVLCGAAGIALQQLATGEPATTGRWVMLVTGSLIGGAGGILATGLFDQILGWVSSGWGVVRSRTRRRVVVMTAFASVLALAVGACTPRLVTMTRRYLGGCPHPVELRVLTSPEQLAAVRDLALAYESSTAGQDGGCRAAHLYVYAAPAGEVRRALVSRWSAEYQVRIGPRPDVWLPDSTVEVAAVQAEATRLSAPLATTREHGPLGYSPIVVAVNAQLLAELRTSPRDPFAGEVSWGVLPARLAAAGVGLLRPDPGGSVVGRLATAALYGGQDAASAAARATEQGIERTLDAGGYPIDDEAALLCRYRAVAAAAAGSLPRVAVIMSEQAMVRYNLGVSLGGECAVPSPPQEAARLMALYPATAPSLDHPLVSFTWNRDSGAEPTARVTERLARWLRGADGQAALLAIGLRPAGLPTVHEPLTRQYGVEAGAVFDRRPPADAQLTEVLRRFAAARRHGRVLLALDGSGSMQSPAGQGSTRFQVAAASIRHVLELMGDRDEFGLLTFHGDGGPGGRQLLVPIGTAGTAVGGVGRRQAAVDALGRVVPEGQTPLYAAVAAAAAEVGPSDDAKATAVVVLTDGVDTTSGMSGEQLSDAVAGRGVRVFVIAVGEARCAGGPLGAVAGRTGGSCREVGFDTADQSMAAIFGALWEGESHA